MGVASPPLARARAPAHNVIVSESESRGLPGGDDESAAVEEVIDRVAERFPDAPRERVEQLAHDEQAQFADAPVRQYVPVLIEHDVTEQLRGEADPLPPTADGRDGAVDDPRPGDPHPADPYEQEPDGAGSAGPLLGDIRS